MRSILGTAFILILAFYSAGFTFGFIQATPQVLLPLVLFIVSYAVYLVHPFVDEKWKRLKEREKAARQVIPEARPDQVGEVGPASLQKPVFPTSTKREASREANQSESPSSKTEHTSDVPAPQAPIDEPIAAPDQSIPPAVPTTKPPQTMNAAQRQPTRTEVDMAAVRDCVGRILSKLDGLPPASELIPDVELFFELVPQGGRAALPKRTRTLAEHLAIARLFERSALTEEEFSDQTDKEIPLEERIYPDQVSISALQDCKLHLRWLQDYYRQIDPPSRYPNVTAKPTKMIQSPKEGKSKAN